MIRHNTEMTFSSRRVGRQSLWCFVNHWRLPPHIWGCKGTSRGRACYRYGTTVLLEGGQMTELRGRGNNIPGVRFVRSTSAKPIQRSKHNIVFSGFWTSFDQFLKLVLKVRELSQFYRGIFLQQNSSFSSIGPASGPVDVVKNKFHRLKTPDFRVCEVSQIYFPAASCLGPSAWPILSWESSPTLQISLEISC